MRLAGKVAVVTGGGSGIGRGIALCLAREGADIAVPDLQEASARSVAGEVQALGRSAIGLRCDVTQEADIRAALDRIVADLGRIDIVVNNAGVASRPGLPFTRNTESDWDQAFDVNVKSVFLMCKAIAPYFSSNAGPGASSISPRSRGRWRPSPCRLTRWPREGSSF